MRVLYLMIGLLGLILTVCALILPIVPATPFLVIALYGFSRSSKRIHHWLVSLPFIKPLYQSLKVHKRFTLKQKIALSLFTLPVAIMPFILLSNRIAQISGVICTSIAFVVIWFYRYSSIEI